MGPSVHSLSFMLLAAALVAGQLPAATASDVLAFIDLGRNAGAPPAHFDFLPAGREGRTRWMLAEDPTAVDGECRGRREDPRGQAACGCSTDPGDPGRRIALDGEIARMTAPLHYRVRPGALKVLLPPA